MEFLEHPSAPQIAYGSTARRAVVFQVRLLPQGTLNALKVFKPQYRSDSAVMTQRAMSRYRVLPGLLVWDRVVFTKNTHRDLVSRLPDLEYAVLMPWITGQTWGNVVYSRQGLSHQECRSLARRFVDIMNILERNGLAHCDIAGGNTVISTDKAPRVELVDVEEMYAPGLKRPKYPGGGSPGYNHRSVAGAWGPETDRFASAVLITELLLWWDTDFRNLSEKEQFFRSGEIQQNTQKYVAVCQMLRGHYGEGIAELFETAWASQTLTECPSLAEWAGTFRQQDIGSEAAIEPIVVPDSISVPYAIQISRGRMAWSERADPSRSYPIAIKLDDSDLSSHPQGVSLPTPEREKLQPRHARALGGFWSSRKAYLGLVIAIVVIAVIVLIVILAGR